MRERSIFKSSGKFAFYDLFGISFAVIPIFAALRLISRMISSCMPLLQIIMTARFVDTGIKIFNGSINEKEIYYPLGGLIGIICYHSINVALNNFLNLKSKMKLNERLRMEIVEKRARLSYSHIENPETWDLIHRVSSDPAGRIDSGFNIFLRLIELMIRVISVLGILFTQIWWISIVIIIFSVPLFYAAIRSGKTEYDAYKDAAKHERRAGYLYSLITGRDNVDERTLFSYSDDVGKKWFEAYEKARKIRLKVDIKNFAKMKGASLITIFISLMITGTLIASLNIGAISIGMFIGLVTASFQLVQMMSFELAYLTKELANSKEFMKDLSSFASLSEVKDALTTPDYFSWCSKFSEIECRNVSFKYPGTTEYVLNNVSIKIKANRQYAFVGANGAGKTTLIKLITGLYHEYEGEILIDGKKLNEYSFAQIKGLFGIVYQDFARYYVSLSENLHLGKAFTIEDADDSLNSKIKEISELIGITELINKLPDGINTPLGRIKESGVDLSVGEWQRIAIARILMKDAPVYVLDEPTASLDPIAEGAVYEMFARVVSGKSAIFVTHRLGAAKIADEILVFKNGTIVEVGSHFDLLEKRGVYAHMYESQKSWYD